MGLRGKDFEEFFTQFLIFERQLSSLSSEEEVGRLAAEFISKVFGFSLCCLSLLPPEGEEVKFYVSLQKKGVSVELVSSLLSFVEKWLKIEGAFFKEGELKRLQIAELPPSCGEFLSSVGIASLLVTPLSTFHKNLGALFFGLSRGYKVTSRRRVLFKSIAVYLALVIDSLRQEKEMAEYLAEVEKKVEERTKEFLLSEERYRNLVEHSLDGIYIIQDNRFLYVNEEFCRIFGFSSPSEAIGRDYRELVAEESLRKVEEVATRKQRGERVLPRYTFWAKRKDGSKFIAELSSVPVMYQGRLAIQGSIRDVTEREKLLSALRESEMRYRSLFENAKDLVYLVDRDGRFIDGNKTAKEISGYRREEMIGKPFLPLVFPEDREKALSRFKKTISGEKHTYSIRIIRKDGEVRTLEISASPLVVEGKIIGSQGIARDVTEREKLLAELKREKTFNERLIETANALIVGLDLEGKIVLFNRKCEELTGYNRDEVIGKKWFDIFLPERWRTRVYEVFSWLKLVALPPTFKNSIVTKTGEERLISWRNALIKDERGRQRMLLSIGEDVTEQEELERKLREVNERLTSLLDNTPDAVVITDTEGIIQYVNPAAEELYEYGRGELVGKHFSILLPKGKLERAMQLFKKVISGEPLKNIESERITKSGKIRNVILTSSPIKDHEGKIVGVAGISKDITEKKMLEEKLRESEERYRTLFEYSGTAVSVIEPDGTYYLVNKRFEELSGRRKEDIEGKLKFYEIHPPEERELLLKRFEAMLRGEKVSPEIELKVVRPNGEVREVRAFGRFIPGTKRLLVSLIDITERKRLEERLRQAEKMASLGQLSAGIAHEINNPLSFVLSNFNSLEEYLSELGGFLSKLRKIKENIGDKEKVSSLSSELIRSFEERDISFILKDLPKLISESKEGLSRIGRIVRELRAFASPRRESLQLLSVNECIETALRFVWHQVKHKAEVIKDYGELPQIRGYPRELSQVFMNLLVNSAQAIEKKGVITIITRKEGEEIIVKVKDTGKGIPREHIPRIFEPFFTTKEGGVGTGLGLSIAYRIIEHHKGRIEVESEVGKGTTFIIYLPYYEG